MKRLILANSLALLIACDLPNKENSSTELIDGEVIMENFDTNNLLNWNIVNDTVMGGRSQATLKLVSDSYANFNGYLSLKNNGGFSSILIKIRGDGRRYNFRIRGNDSRWASYTHSFDTIKGEWIEKELIIDDFYPVYRGYSLKNMPLLSEIIIKEIGIMISDKTEGPFNIEIDWIKAK
jgi:NADH dehydrogenase [ubiquinone] 1 alpha subcomplex assembly factor 1